MTQPNLNRAQLEQRLQQLQRDLSDAQRYREQMRRYDSHVMRNHEWATADPEFANSGNHDWTVWDMLGERANETDRAMMRSDANIRRINLEITQTKNLIAQKRIEERDLGKEFHAIEHEKKLMAEEDLQSVGWNQKERAKAQQQAARLARQQREARRAEQRAQARLAEEEAQARLAEEEARWRKKMIRAGCVVGALGVLQCIIFLVLPQTGVGDADRGGELDDSGAQLRGNVSDRLLDASPKFGSWSGSRGRYGAENYADQQRRQLVRAAAVAQADQQAAHAVAVQADQVTQARWELEATLAVLAGGIAVAISLTAAWSAACGTPAEKAYETALIGFGTALALYTIAVVIQVLVTLDDAGKHTKKSLNAVTDAYQQVINDVVANLPTRSACIGWMPTASTPPTFSSSELAAGRSSSPAPIHSTNDDQSRKNTAQSLITGLLGDRPSGQQGPQTAAVKLPALSGLEQLHQQAAAFPKTVFQQLNRPSRPLTQLHWLAAVATPTTTHETTPPDVMASDPTETTLKTIVATGPLTNRKRELRDDARSDPPASLFIKC